MDHIDRKILAELQQNGRITNAELAKRINLSPSPCLRRVRRLEREGIIQGYQVLLNPAALGYNIEVFVTVRMEHEDQATLAKFEREVSNLSEVSDVYQLFGDPDYLLHVRISDVTAYEHLYAKTLTNLPGVAMVTSHMKMKQVKRGPGI